ncbi:MAG: ATP-grasp domain-containing protein [Bacteroidales bacterium]|nr:ATP-grasp domain-containing protein [Bacteroidales bacterium]
MIIGITFDLRSEYLKEGYTLEETAEFDRDSTIAGLEAALQHLGYNTDRIGHVRQLANRLVKGDRWDLVFNISEGLSGIGREAQVPCLLDAYQIAYTFSDPLVLSLTLHKGMTKRVIRDAGLNTPGFFIVHSEAEILTDDLDFPLFIKPVAEGTGKGISGKSRVNSSRELQEVCRKLLRQYPAGLLVEEFLPGREFTVGITGTGAKSRPVGIMEIVYKQGSAREIYSLETKTNYEELVTYTVPEESVKEACIELAIRVWNILGCRDGGRVDIRYDRHGEPSFIEVNPLAGLDHQHSDLPILAYRNGYTYEQLIGEIMTSALERINHLPKP